MKSSELLEQSGRAHFLLGNEAVVRGLYEAGVSVAATYPGTPRLRNWRFVKRDS